MEFAGMGTDGAGDMHSCGGDGGAHNPVRSGDGDAVCGGDAGGAAYKSGQFVQSKVRRMDYERICKVIPPVQGDGQWSAHFIASLDPALAGEYARLFYEDGAFVGANGIDLKRLCGGDMDSTPFLSALMQLSAIQTAVAIANGRDVVIGYSIWDCFFNTPQYAESMDSMWRYLFKVMKTGGVGRIDFTILFDESLQGHKMERQKKYVGFCSSFFKRLFARRRMAVVVVDEKLKQQLK